MFPYKISGSDCPSVRSYPLEGCAITNCFNFWSSVALAFLDFHPENWMPCCSLVVPMNPSDERLFAPATERNREPILAVLQEFLPLSGLVLEIASGTGEHISYFAPRLSPNLQWQPSDFETYKLASIAAWCRFLNTTNVQPPLQIDVTSENWGLDRVDAILATNLIHIAPWSACCGLLAGAERLLPPSGILYLYGPFKREGKHTAPSNETFDQMLKSENSAWGVRDLETVTAAAKQHGLAFEKLIPMPANNFSVIFRRQAISG